MSRYVQFLHVTGEKTPPVQYSCASAVDLHQFSCVRVQSTAAPGMAAEYSLPCGESSQSSHPAGAKNMGVLDRFGRLKIPIMNVFWFEDF